MLLDGAPIARGRVLFTLFVALGGLSSFSGLSGFEFYFEPSRLVLIEMVISVDSRRDWHPLREELFGAEYSGTNKVNQAGQIFPVIAISGPHRDVLLHGFTHRKRLQLWRIDANDRQGSGFGHRSHCPFEGLRGRAANPPFFAGLFRIGIDGLHFRFELLLHLAAGVGGRRVHSDGINDPIRSRPQGELAKDFHRVLAAEIDSLCAMRSRMIQPRLDLVNGKHAAGPEVLGTSDGQHPHGPQPNTATVSPEWISAIFAA